MLLHIINLFYNFVVYNLIVCNLFGNILRYCYSFSAIDTQGLHLYCMQQIGNVLRYFLISRVLDAERLNFHCMQSIWQYS